MTVKTDHLQKARADKETHHLLQKEEGKDVAKYFGLVPRFVASSHACGGTFISSKK